MPTVCLPHLATPEHEVSLDLVLGMIPEVYSGHPRLSTLMRIAQNSGVENRFFVQPPHLTVEHPGFEDRHRMYADAARSLSEVAVSGALTNAGVTSDEIDLIISTSCTGFMIPSVDAHLVNRMGFRHSVRRSPIAQLGCAGGAAALGKAYEFIRAFPDANVLVLAVELCSLCFQPDDLSLGAVVSALIFGDGVAATVVRGSGGKGFGIERAGSRLLPDTEHYMGFDVRSTGFHIILDKAVPEAVETGIVPAMRDFLAEDGERVDEMDFFLLHPGGSRVITELEKHLPIGDGGAKASRQCLAEMGNLSSASILAVLRNAMREGDTTNGDVGLLAAFGPGFSVEMCRGRWQGPAD